MKLQVTSQDLTNGLEVNPDTSALLTANDNRLLWTTNLQTAIGLVIVFKNEDILLNHSRYINFNLPSLNFLKCSEMIDTIAEIHFYTNEKEERRNAKVWGMMDEISILFDTQKCENTPTLYLHDIPGFDAILIRRSGKSIEHFSAKFDNKLEQNEFILCDKIAVFTPDPEQIASEIDKREAISRHTMFFASPKIEPLTFEKAEEQLHQQDGKAPVTAKSEEEKHKKCIVM